MGGIFSLQLDGSDYQLVASFTPETGGLPQMGALLLSADGYMVCVPQSSPYPHT
jgi:hypothetical protein